MSLVCCVQMCFFQEGCSYGHFFFSFCNRMAVPGARILRSAVPYESSTMTESEVGWLN
jgi:hypothetical protein